jgi:hypothetical protein
MKNEPCALVFEMLWKDHFLSQSNFSFHSSVLPSNPFVNLQRWWKEHRIKIYLQYRSGTLSGTNGHLERCRWGFAMNHHFLDNPVTNQDRQEQLLGEGSLPSITLYSFYLLILLLAFPLVQSGVSYRGEMLDLKLPISLAFIIWLEFMGLILRLFITPVLHPKTS